jgi:hypothetical protein
MNGRHLALIADKALYVLDRQTLRPVCQYGLTSLQQTYAVGLPLYPDTIYAIYYNYSSVVSRTQSEAILTISLYGYSVLTKINSDGSLDYMFRIIGNDCTVPVHDELFIADNLGGLHRIDSRGRLQHLATPVTMLAAEPRLWVQDQQLEYNHAEQCLEWSAEGQTFNLDIQGRPLVKASTTNI